MPTDQPPSVEFGEVDGTFGDVLEAVTRDRQSVLRVRRSDIRSIGEKLPAQQASAEIAIGDGAKLAIYEKRWPVGIGYLGATVRIDLGTENFLNLSPQSAHQLACALLAYSALENKRCDWLVRVEPVER
ncbi:hypothetical protein D3C78_1485360 [compost metagenome]